VLVLRFEGWFQCRLATNPDPTDEPRGVSGHTFARAGEPDLDRVIRLRDPVAPRSHGPPVGVRVTEVHRRGERVAAHPLAGARVDLLDRPKFESRNLLLSDDRAGVGPIHPFHLEVAGAGVAVRRLDLLDPDRPGLEPHRAPPALLNRRSAVDRDGLRWDPTRIAEATGLVDPLAFRAERRRRLLADLERVDDPLARAALAKRIRELAVVDRHDPRVVGLSVVQVRRFGLDGPARVVEAGRRLEPLDLDREWPIEFWMGGWDSDALSGYLSGLLTIPLRGGRPARRATREHRPAVTARTRA
jgi:hypothetical protein